MPGGAIGPCQEVTTRSGSPVSTAVGTPGSTRALVRADEDRPHPPALDVRCEPAGIREHELHANMSCTLPATASVIAAAGSVPVTRLNGSIVVWSEEPTPEAE